MLFLKHLNSSFDQRREVLLAKAEITTLDETIVTLIQEESRMKLHSDNTRLLGVTVGKLFPPDGNRQTDKRKPDRTDPEGIRPNPMENWKQGLIYK